MVTRRGLLGLLAASPLNRLTEDVDLVEIRATARRLIKLEKGDKLKAGDMNNIGRALEILIGDGKKEVRL